jgi:predicted transcriptional regulator
MRGLIIRSPYVEWILDGKKTWEIRGSNSHVRGKIALIRSGSGLVVGTCNLVDVMGPLSLLELKQNAAKLGKKRSEISATSYEKTYAWVLSNAKRLKHPRRYKHRPGAIIWVKLSGF